MRAHLVKLFFGQLLSCMLFLGMVSQARAAVVEKGAEQKSPDVEEQPSGDTVGKVLSKFIAVETGEIRDGEQIPLPKYQDGTVAERKQCRYFVSPKEISTAFTFLGGPGAYFITCGVDENGVVHSSLWQHGGSLGKDVNVIKDESYEELKKYYESIGTQYEGHDDFRFNLMKGVRQRVLVNYMVIAIRSD